MQLLHTLRPRTYMSSTHIFHYDNITFWKSWLSFLMDETNDERDPESQHRIIYSVLAVWVHAPFARLVNTVFLFFFFEKIVRDLMEGWDKHRCACKVCKVRGHRRSRHAAASCLNFQIKVWLQNLSNYVSICSWMGRAKLQSRKGYMSEL